MTENKEVDLEPVNLDEVFPEEGTEEISLEEEALNATSFKNIPYKKIFNSEGDLANPITKGNPYLNPFMNRRAKKALIRSVTRNPKNNKKGIRLVVSRLKNNTFTKTRVVKQVLPSGKTIIHNVLQ